MVDSKVIFEKLIETNHKNNIFEGTYKLTGQKIIIKQSQFHDISQFTQGLQELICQAKLQHRCFCSLIDAFFSESPAGYELNLCMERLDTDLQKEIGNRALRGEMYREQELWEFLQSTVEALALAQSNVSSIQSICHRDLKPANIFLEKEVGEYKIGDFGASKMASEEAAINTLQGTAAYMSPELRAASTGLQPPEYNPFTSDVYSLGMTWLSMAVLRVFTSDDMQELVINEDWQERLLAGLPYSEDLKIMLKGMLSCDPRQRPDFRDLNKWFKSRETGLEASWSLDPSESQLQRLLGRLLAEKWGSDFASPTLYLKQLDVVEQLAKLSPAAASKAAKYEFPYIPLSHVLSDFTDQSTPSLLIHKTTTSDLLTQISVCCRAFKPPGSSLIVRKQHQVVTVSEPAASQPSISVKLKPHLPRPLLDFQLFRFGKTAKMSILASNQPQLILQISIGAESKQYCYTSEQSPILIGRSCECSLWLLTETISLKHAEIAWNGKWTLQDLGSTNGTWVFCHSLVDCWRESNEERVEDGTEVSDSVGKCAFRIDKRYLD